MREILFRGKRIDNGEWEYGQLKSIHKGGRNYETAYYILNIYGESRLAKDAIDPNTIGQFTGLCDKNGKKIFEGDIVVCDFDYKLEPMEVIFYKGGFKLKSDNCKEPYDYSIHDDDMNPDLLVIDNIHDNPELLGLTMGRITDKIREYIRCPELDGGTEYGEWGALRKDQRLLINKLCNQCDYFENMLDLELKRKKNFDLL